MQVYPEPGEISFYWMVFHSSTSVDVYRYSKQHLLLEYSRYRIPRLPEHPNDDENPREIEKQDEAMKPTTKNRYKSLQTL